MEEAREITRVLDDDRRRKDNGYKGPVDLEGKYSIEIRPES